MSNKRLTNEEMAKVQRLVPLAVLDLNYDDKVWRDMGCPPGVDGAARELMAIMPRIVAELAAARAPVLRGDIDMDELTKMKLKYEQAGAVYVMHDADPEAELKVVRAKLVEVSAFLTEAASMLEEYEIGCTASCEHGMGVEDAADGHGPACFALRARQALADVDLDLETDLTQLLAKLYDGGGRRTGELIRRGWIRVQLTPAGYAILFPNGDEQP